MKILFDARHIKDIYSGLARYTFSILDALIDTDIYENLEVIFDKNNDYSNNHLYSKIKEKKNKSINFTYLDTPLFGLKHHINISKYVNQNNCDIYFYPHFDMPVFIKKKSIFVVHDLLPLVVDNYILKYKFLKQQYFKNLININLNKTNTTCIAVSNSTKQDIIKYINNKENKIKVVYEDSFEIPIVKEKISDEVLDILKLKYLFYIGDRRPHKNLKKMIEIFEIMQKKYNYDGYFILAGSPKNFDVDIDTYIDNNQFIKYLGKVSDEELVLLYKNMEALFFLSKYEGFGLPIIEAAKQNKKVITSNISSCVEIAPKNALIVDPQDNNEKLAELCYNYCMKNISINNKKYLEKFSWKNSVYQIFEGLK